MAKRYLASSVDRKKGVAYNRFAFWTEIQGGRLTVATKVGTRYVCTVCNSEFIVTRAGEGELVCCKKPMQVKTGGK